MLREIYTSFKRFSVNSYLKLLTHYQIREDVVEMYRACVIVMMQMPESKQRTNGDTNFWFKRAFHFGEKAKDIDPHKKVIEKCDDTIEEINVLESFYSKFSKISLLLMLIFGGSSIFAYFQVVPQNRTDNLFQKIGPNSVEQ